MTGNLLETHLVVTYHFTKEMVLICLTLQWSQDFYYSDIVVYHFRSVHLSHEC